MFRDIPDDAAAATVDAWEQSTRFFDTAVLTVAVATSATSWARLRVA
jgi:hypothetical protein